MKHFLSLVLLLAGLTATAQTTMNIYQNNGTVLQIPLSSIDSITYTVNNPGNLATLSTLPVGSITATSAVSGGNITAGGGTPVTQRGVCWSTTPNPTTANNTSSNGSGVGNYTSNLIGLVAGATYYVRAYAINSAGTAYGNEVQFTAGGGGGGLYTPGPGVTDQNGNSYTTIILNNGQEWMAENLRTTTYANGDPIPNVTTENAWGQLSTGAWRHYLNDSSFENPYGKLYNWYAASDPRNVCPVGWHVPTDGEWQQLELALGMPELELALGGLLYAGGGFPQRGVDQNVGGKMKSIGTQYWFEPNIGPTNESGFSGLPGGSHEYDSNNSVNIGHAGNWWSASESTSYHAWFRQLNRGSAGVYRFNYDKRNGFCLRCVRD